MTIDDDIIAFRNLSPARQRTLGREARIFCNQFPYMADASGWWRSLPARYVAALAWRGTAG